jgi:hypothetical protein
MLDVKTNSARFPIKYIQENLGHESGSWLVLSTMDVNGEKLFCLGHRRGGSIHFFVSSCGTTVRGKDQSHKEDLLTAEGIMAPRKTPCVVNDIDLAGAAQGRFAQRLAPARPRHRGGLPHRRLPHAYPHHTDGD